MNKTEFIERVAMEADGSVGEAQRYFDAAENVVTPALKDGEEVEIMSLRQVLRPGAHGMSACR